MTILDDGSLRTLLEQVRAGAVGVDDAVGRLRTLPFEDLGFAKVDHHRAIRCGFPEVIFGLGKTPELMVALFRSISGRGQTVLATRAAPEAVAAVTAEFPAVEHNPAARTLVLWGPSRPQPEGLVLVVSAGTSDLPVAEEARVTAEAMGARVETIFDVGVAGLHRLLAHSPRLQSANVLVVVAGMEGALPSVVSGLTDVPVIAVPTSIGYGANFLGLAPLLTMLNSCASGVAVVNIDAGFNGGRLAALINRLACHPRVGPRGAGGDGAQG